MASPSIVFSGLGDAGCQLLRNLMLTTGDEERIVAGEQHRSVQHSLVQRLPPRFVRPEGHLSRRAVPGEDGGAKQTALANLNLTLEPTHWCQVSERAFCCGYGVRDPQRTACGPRSEVRTTRNAASVP